ncbi:MAG: hypothetical protein K8T90_14660 [Planctomycetes bacterium]|nr:hypothetical protein [Planctomycetota bacterium]
MAGAAETLDPAAAQHRDNVWDNRWDNRWDNVWDNRWDNGCDNRRRHAVAAGHAASADAVRRPTAAQRRRGPRRRFRAPTVRGS